MPKKYTHELFLKKLKENFGDKISLKDSIYKNSQTKVKCKCNVCGYEWFTKPYSLLAGHGCRKCFDKNGIKYKQWYRNAWLGLQSLDFFIESKKIAIEVQGIEHFEANEYFGGEKGLKNNIERDERKKTLCEKKHVRLVYFLEEKNTKYMNQNDVYFTKIEKLLKYINEIEDEIVE